MAIPGQLLSKDTPKVMGTHTISQDPLEIVIQPQTLNAFFTLTLIDLDDKIASLEILSQSPDLETILERCQQFLAQSIDKLNHGQVEMSTVFDHFKQVFVVQPIVHSNAVHVDSASVAKKKYSQQETGVICRGPHRAALWKIRAEEVCDTHESRLPGESTHSPINKCLAA